GLYSVVLDNAFGSVTSNPARLEVAQVAVWGAQDQDQRVLPFGLTNLVAIAGGWEQSAAIRRDGAFITWGSRYGSYPPPGMSHVLSVAFGAGHGLALLTDGTVQTWGGDSRTNVPPGLTNVIAVAAGGWHSLALLANGRVVAWGYNSYGETDVPQDLTGVVAI